MESEDSSYYPKGCYQSGNSPELYVYFNTNSNGAIDEKSQTICFASNGDGKKILHFSIESISSKNCRKDNISKNLCFFYKT